jgi:dGTPase
VLKDFLFERVYEASTGAARQIDKVGEVIDALFRFYMREPSLLPGSTRGLATRALARVVCDYIAGMTDRFARQKFLEHFVPEGWRTD